MLLLNQNSLFLGLGIALFGLFAPVSEAARTVAASERGLYYGLPYQCYGNFNCTDWTGIGAYLGQFNYQYYFDRMDPSTLKLGHGRLQHFAAFDDTSEALFPYSQLVQYDASEVAAGRTSLFATATYQGVRRPVIWTWYGISSSFYVNNPGRPVNLNDERFVQFWINQYVRPWMQKINKPNVAVLLDNCTFDYNLYGVRDNAGNFIPGVTWDQPFPQNQAQFLSSVNNFVNRVHQIDPSIKMVCNTDASSNQADFLASSQNLDGIGIESMEYFYQSGDPWWRSKFYDQYVNASWMGNAGKIGLMVWNVVNDANVTNNMRRNYMHYLMVRGDNFFFTPQFGNLEVPTSYYSAMATALGTPTGTTVVTPQAGYPVGYNLYSRTTTGGIAYLNWSGVAKTITLPAGRQYVNAAGQPVTQIYIPDMSGDYVLFSGSTASNQSPTVTLTAPANGATYAAPATITMTATASDADGSIARVEFYQGANKLGEDTTSPYTWTASNVPAASYTGAYAFTARAIDNAGAAATSNSVGVTVGGSTGNSAPTVSLTTPVNGANYAAYAPITLTATASDSNGYIVRVEYYQGANKLGEAYTAPYTLTLPSVPPGNYTGTYGFTARAVDNAGATATSSVAGVTVGGSTGNQAPTVTLTAPISGAIYSAPATITMTATASDADGYIARVEFYQGNNKLGEKYAAPYTWTVSGAPVGSYTGAYAFWARAVDNSGAITNSNAASVTVR